MKLKVADKIVAADWDRDVCALGGTVFHSNSWSEFILSSYPNAHPLYVVLHSDMGELIGMAMGFKYSSPRRLLSHFTGTLQFDALPLIVNNDPSIFCEFIEQIESYARSTGCVDMELGSFASQDFSDELRDHGYHVSDRMEFELSLESTHEELWSRLEARRRYDIKKGQNHNLHVCELPLYHGVAELRQLQAASAERIMKRGGPDIRYVGTEAVDPLHTLMKAGVGRIVGAEISGNLISAIFFTNFNNRVYQHIAGHSQYALETQTPTLLLWESIKRFRKEGATRFNLGGCGGDAVSRGSSEHGVYMYKRGFGAECIPCSSGHKTLHPFRRSLYKTAVRFLRR